MSSREGHGRLRAYYQHGGVRIFHGDCRAVLPELPSESVHCCVTSPPYWGLRDYGTAQWQGGKAECDHISRPNESAKSKTNDGALRDNPYKGECGKCGAKRIDAQIGLEKTPELYVAEMVAIFRQVKRVLRKDGTLWLNLGDSYAGRGQGRNGDGSVGKLSEKQRSNRGTATAELRHGIGDVENLKPKDLCGIPWAVAFALRQPYTDWRIKDEAMRAWVGGIVDGEGCITILRTKSSHSDSLSFPPVVQVRMCDTEPLQRLVDVAGSSFGKPQLPPSYAAANQREAFQWKLVSEAAAKVITEIYPYLTCKRKQAIVAWNHQQFRSARGNQERKSGELEKERFCKELINKLNQRQAADIPSWMKEPVVQQEPGWYLRQDLIWAKPNPMPESVVDRCTKAHEYIFLLSKSATYFYDAGAIKEAAAYDGRQVTTCTDVKRQGSELMWAGSHERWARNGDGDYVRNKRSVWEIATSPFPEAHFATFPPELIKPCILAGCPAGGIVLDPFMGAGTTALVAQQNHCKSLGIELNQEYIEIAAKRLSQEVLDFTSPGESEKKESLL